MPQICSLHHTCFSTLPGNPRFPKSALSSAQRTASNFSPACQASESSPPILPLLHRLPMPGTWMVVGNTICRASLTAGQRSLTLFSLPPSGKGQLMFPRIPPPSLCPLPRNCLLPVPQSPHTHSHACGEKQWTTINLVFPERMAEGHESSSGQFQRMLSASPAASQGMDGEHIQIPYPALPGKRGQQGTGTIRSKSLALRPHEY